MIGLDTNVIVRYLAQDDPEQAAAATALVESLTERDPGFVSMVVVVEVSWVLRRSYQADRWMLADVLDRLVSSPEIIVENSDAVRAAIERSRESGEFADALIDELSRRAGCRYTVTFDRRAAQQVGMVLVASVLG